MQVSKIDNTSRQRTSFNRLVSLDLSKLDKNGVKVAEQILTDKNFQELCNGKCGFALTSNKKNTLIWRFGEFSENSGNNIGISGSEIMLGKIKTQDIKKTSKNVVDTIIAHYNETLNILEGLLKIGQ